MWIVKLGGSLADDVLLTAWLNTLARCGGGRVIVVPGGGAFADTVREAQQSWGFDDVTAHRMALLAMEQYGLMLAGLCPSLTPTRSRDEIYDVLRHAGIAVWLPTAMTDDCEDIPQNWSITSDTLSAWLARRLSAERLVLVKSCTVPGQVLDPVELSRLGVVDPAFPEWIRQACFKTFVLRKDQHQTLQLMLQDSRLAD